MSRPMNELVELAASLGGVVRNAEADTLTKRLIERRITPEVIATFQIEPRGNGWQYPTPGGGLRWKNFDSNATPKYQWLDGKSESASALYYAEDLRDHVAMSGGVCWYVSGEPDVWAMRSAGRRRKRRNEPMPVEDAPLPKWEQPRLWG